MSIPKVIYQTYISWNKIPLMAKLHIWKMRKLNPDFKYCFYDDNAIIEFLKNSYPEDVLKQYLKINIGAAKADFFRYAILLKNGGVYVDIDSIVASRLGNWIKANDKAIITQERNPGVFVQWALIYEKEHPFLKETFNTMLENIRHNKFPHDVREMTGPVLYSKAIKKCLKEDPKIDHREFGVDYEGRIRFKFWLSGFSFRGREHWKKAQLVRPVLKS